MEGMETAEAIQREQLERMRDFLGPRASMEESEVGKTVAKREAPIAFSNPRAREFFVDGTKIPDVDFDIGESELTDYEEESLDWNGN